MTKISGRGIVAAVRAYKAYEDAYQSTRDVIRAAITAYLNTVKGEDNNARTDQECLAPGITHRQVDLTASDPRYPQALAEATARAKGENLDGSPRRECSLAEIGIPASDPAPAGWRMVPVEPTETQIELLAKAYDRVSFDPEEDGLLDVAQPVRDRARYDARLLYPLLLAASPEPPTGDGWRDIASAPKDGTEIIAWSRYFSSAAPYRWNGKTWTASHEMSDVIEYQSDSGTTYKSDTILTHWQPLPAAPKGRE